MYDEYKKVINHATRYLNCVIDANIYPIDKIKETTLAIRPVGLGLMGVGHALYKLGIRYGSDESLKWIDNITRMLTVEGMWTSVELSKEEGGSYPAYCKETFFKANERFLKHDLDLTDAICEYGIRNSCNSSIAPTGTISYLSKTSGGIEPIFALVFARRIEKINKQYETVYIIDPIFEAYLDKSFDTNEKESILEQVAKNNGSCQNVTLIPKEYRDIFVTAGDLSADEHLDFLASVSKNISTSVSKTINLPEDATVEDIANVYTKAHSLGVIGVSVYRDKCRDGVLVSVEEAKRLSGELKEDNKDNKIKRPRVLDGKTYQLREEEDHKTYFAINYNIDGDVKVPWEMFLFSSSKNHEWYAAIGRLASKLMRRTGDVKEVIDELKAIKGDNGFLTKEYGYVHSRPYYLGCVLEEFAKSIGDPNVEESTSSTCPECGSDSIIKEGGCTRCLECGYDKCG